MASVNSPAHGSTRITHIFSGATDGATINVIFDGSTFGSDIKLPSSANGFVWTGASWYTTDGGSGGAASVILTMSSVVVAGIHGHQYGGMMELPTPILIPKPATSPTTGTAATFTVESASTATIRFTLFGYWI